MTSIIFDSHYTPKNRRSTIVFDLSIHRIHEMIDEHLLYFRGGPLGDRQNSNGNQTRAVIYLNLF